MCCENCFTGEYVKRYITANGYLGNCSFCSSFNVKCIEPIQLYQILIPLLNLYSEEDELLDEVIQEYIDDNGLADCEIDDIDTDSDEFNNSHSSSLAERIGRDFALFNNQLDTKTQNEILDKILSGNTDVESYARSPWQYFLNSPDESTKVTKLWQEFKALLRFYRFTFDINKDFLEKLYFFDDLFFKYVEEIIDTKQIFYRARLGYKKSSQFFLPYKDEEISAPPPNLAKSQRLSPNGVSFLYLSEEKETCISEVRPFKRAVLSVGKFKLVKPLKVVNFSSIPLIQLSESINPKNQAYGRRFLQYISNEFSKPYEPEFVEIEYLSTQYLAEVIMRLGYDGIKYNSAMTLGGVNLLLFDKKNAAFVESESVLVKDIRYEAVGYDTHEFHKYNFLDIFGDL